MGFPLDDSSPSTNTPAPDLQRYYSELYREYTADNSPSFPLRQTVGSILSRTRLPTKTYDSRQLALLDVDKILSFNTGSMKEKDEQVKYMRMVAGLMQQADRAASETPNRQIQHLVRLARLHFMSQNRQQSEEQRNPPAEV